MGQLHPEFLVHAQHEAGAVRSLGQTRAAPHIGISHELLGILHQIHPHVGHSYAVQKLGHGNGSVQLLLNGHILLRHIGLLTVYGNLDPALQRLQPFKLCAVGHLRQHRAVRVGLVPDVEPVHLGNGHRAHQIVGLQLRVGAREQKLQTDIALHLTGHDMGPAVHLLHHLAGRVLGHLSHQLPGGGRFLSHIQVPALHVCDADVRISPGRSLSLLSIFNIFFRSHSGFQNRGDACPRQHALGGKSLHGCPHHAKGHSCRQHRNFPALLISHVFSLP